MPLKYCTSSERSGGLHVAAGLSGIVTCFKDLITDNEGPVATCTPPIESAKCWFCSVLYTWNSMRITDLCLVPFLLLLRVTITAQAMDAYDFSTATQQLYAWWQYDLCDVFIELMKPVMARDTAQAGALGAHGCWDRMSSPRLRRSSQIQYKHADYVSDVKIQCGPVELTSMCTFELHSMLHVC